ncbi:MAG: hypothetical protein MUE63_11610 [Xanthomonadales bacterium]|nr:hypothetical protein [Xanthomonadales bacterium]
MAVLAPDKVSVPVPYFSKRPLPANVPLKAVDELSAPALRKLPARLTVPAPASEPMVSFAPSASVAPPAMVTADRSPMALPPLACSVPALIVVAPL